MPSYLVEQNEDKKVGLKIIKLKIRTQNQEDLQEQDNSQRD